MVVELVGAHPLNSLSDAKDGGGTSRDVERVGMGCREGCCKGLASCKAVLIMFVLCLGLALLVYLVYF